MPDLLQSLQGRDLGHLRIVAELCGIELTASETETARQELATALLQPETLAEVLDALPHTAHNALATLLEYDGKIPWAVFARRFGEIRTVGAARRDREKFYLSPISPAEILFYRALLARAFFDTPDGAQEFAYLPTDLAARIREHNLLASSSPFAAASIAPAGQAATPEERACPLPPFDYLLADATTLLAALRMGRPTPTLATPPPVVLAFLRAARLVDDDTLQPEAVRAFLKAPPDQALNTLRQAWEQSASFNELRLMPNLICEGEWQNDPRRTRRLILDWLEHIPRGQWWSLRSFLQAIKERNPDFQRPAGDYDSWFIRRAADGTYLRGFAHWDEVDGALIAYLITGPLFWLRKVELAAPAKDAAPTAFRLLTDEAVPLPNEEARLHVSSQGRISVPRLAPRAVRYQIARFCEWQEASHDTYHYQVTAASLQQARAQGLKVNHLLTLLARHAAAELPPAFVKAVQRWERQGCEARLERLTVLRVIRPEILEALRHSKARRFLAEPLGPTSVVVKNGASLILRQALAELGWLVESADDISEEENPGF